MLRQQWIRLGTIFLLVRILDTVNLDETNVSLYFDERNHTFSQSTVGIRLSRYMGSGQLSLLGFRGPDTEPSLSIGMPSKQELPIKLNYFRRSLIGLNYDVSYGSAVWRIEAAYIPDQSINTKWQQRSTINQAARSLLGLALDWQAGDQVFINAQVIVDYIDLPERLLSRPKTDRILTFRIQRPFLNQRILLKSELLASLNQHDGLIRPGFVFELNDSSKLNGGVDWAFGNRKGQFGQFKDSSRFWLGLSFEF